MINYHRTPRRLLTLCLACLFTATAPAQVLARPGWAGSGITTDLWWKRAVIYQVNPANFSPIDGSPIDGSPLHGVAQRLDYIHSLGTDALLLTSLQPDPTHAEAIDPTLGTLDDIDDLLRQAGNRHLRVLLDLDPAIPADDLPNVARFWLNRGIAGFHVSGTNDAAHSQADVLRKTADSYLGQRILIADAPPEIATNVAPAPQPPPPSLPHHTTRGRHHAHARSKSPSRPPTSLDTHSPQLLLETHLGSIAPLSATAIRPVIDHLQYIQQAGHSLPLLATDGPAFPRSMSRYADGQHDLAIAKLLATILFTTRSESLLYYGQELGVRTPAAPTSTPDATTPLITWDAPPPPAKSQPAPPAETYVPYKPPTANLNAAPNAALEEADPDSLLNWYRQLSALHRDNATLATGTSLTINRDDQNILVLIRKPKPEAETKSKTASAHSPVLVLLFNLTAQPVQLSLKADTTRLDLRGSFLRTVMRSDGGMGTMNLDSMTLAPYAAYIGELRY